MPLRACLRVVLTAWHAALMMHSQLEVDKSKGLIGLSCQELTTMGGVVISGFKKGSLLEPFGICLGCLLLSVNGEMVFSHKRAVELVDSAENQVQLVIRELAVELTLTLTAGGDTGLLVRDHPLGLGVAVSTVREGSAAAAAGLELSDVILAIGDEIVREAARATTLLQSVGPAPLKITKRA